MQRGFDHYFGFNPSGTAYWDSPSMYVDENLVKVPGYLTDALSKEAVRVISDKNTAPFFLYLAYNAPHTPYDPAPESYRNRFDTGNERADNFFAMLAAVDDGVGNIVEALKQNGQWDNTLIVFASDNGGVSDSPLPRNGDMKGYKGMFYQGGAQVPMFIRLPNSSQGDRYSFPVSLMDILPTCLAAAKIDVPEGLDGVNLLPFLKGSNRDLPHQSLYWAGPFNPQWASGDSDYDHLRDLTDLPRGPAGGAVCSWPYLMSFGGRDEIELINIEKGDNKNIARTNPERISEFRESFQQWIAPMPPSLNWSHLQWKQLRE